MSLSRRRGKARLVFSDLSPVDLDRRLERAEKAWIAWRERLATSAGPDDDPLAAFRAVTGKPLFAHLSGLPDHDPLREPLRRWVYRLAEQRINHAALTAEAAEWQRRRPVADAPGVGEHSPREMLESCLGDVPRRAGWARAFARHAGDCSSAAVRVWQRRHEVARRMGLEDATSAQAPAPGLLAAAERFGRETRDRLRELELGTLPDYVAAALGADAPGEWPARLSPARMLDAFRDGDLLRSLDLKPRRLPRSLGAASYCRALGILGEQWQQALAPTDQPFVIAHDAYGLPRHRAAGLFAALPLSAAFLQRKLGVPRHALRDAQRRLAQMALLELASLALRVRLHAPALSSESELRESFAELSASELSLPLPRSLAGALFRLDVEDPQRWLGRLMAAESDRRLSDAHDEDWFRNPRAVEQLRAEARQPPAMRLDADTLERALGATLRRLEAWLG